MYQGNYTAVAGAQAQGIDALIEQALKAIYEETVDIKDDIEPGLFSITYGELNKAVDDVFAGISYDDPDYEFTQQLRRNNAVFAAFKTHRQQNDVAAQLLDVNGDLKSFTQFKKDTEALVGEYNTNWLRTEYDTAVIRARMAARFKEYQRNADLFPNLRWERSTSVIKREIHVKLYGLILPIEHPLWQTMFPGIDWNCKCGITNTDEDPNGDRYNIDSLDIVIPGGLEGNPAFTGALFGTKHPYRVNAYKGAARAVKNFTKNVK